jgi:hypothetical protein
MKKLPTRNQTMARPPAIRIETHWKLFITLKEELATLPEHLSSPRFLVELVLLDH